LRQPGASQLATKLVAFYGVMLALILLGKTLVRLTNGLDAHLRRVCGSKPPPQASRHHEYFDDAV
jgi:hypothetical protein